MSKMTSHQLAQLMIEKPDMPVVINYDGEYNAYVHEGSGTTQLDGTDVFILCLGESAPTSPINAP